MGCYPDDVRIQNALDLAAAQGLAITFATKDLGDVHPNTVSLRLASASEEVEVVGSSLGGGLVRIFKVNGFDISFSGAYHTLLLEHEDKPGVIARVARVIADDEVNIATLHCARRKRGGFAMMSVEVDRQLSQYVLDYLTCVPYVRWMRFLPEVMRGQEVTSQDAG